MTKLLSAALLAAVSMEATASAQTLVAIDGGERRAPREVDGRLGMLLGGSDVGDADGFSAGIAGAIGYRVGDLTVRGLFDYYRVGDAADETLARNGRAVRVGSALRYSFANTGHESKVGVDFWGELGIGAEHVMWRHGGILDRPSGELAFGLDLARRGRIDARGDRKKIGYFMAFRSLVAQGPEMDGVMAACGGPCSQATKPPRTDVSMFFELGVHWGR
jgi:hypothetical protein